MEQSVLSKGGVVIRLTDERWTHVTEEHSELAGLRLDVLETISEPDHIVAGAAGELLAIRAKLNRTNGSSWCIVNWVRMASS